MKTITGYMCATDYYHELGSCECMVYPSLKTIKEKCDCVKECGIVKVEVSLVEVVQGRAEDRVEYQPIPEKTLEQTIETARSCGWPEEKIKKELIDALRDPEETVDGE